MKGRFRQLVENSRWLKAVPNSLTLCNSLCGFAAILYTLRAYEYMESGVQVFAISAWLILFAMVFDSLDGFAARIFNAASMHGIQMDSLADMVTFGVAPATLVAILAHTQRATMSHFELPTYILCSVYLGGAALRLATYNVHAMVEKKSSDKFSGLPSPGAAAAICSVVLWAEYSDLIAISQLTVILPIFAAILGLLMVSKVPYTHFGKWILSVKRNRQRQLAVIMILAALFIFKADALITLVVIYIFSGPVMALFNLLKGKKA